MASDFTYGAYHWGNGAASTVAFFVLSFLELFHAFNVRTENKPLGIKGLISNKTLLITIVIGVAVNVLLAVVPVFRTAFSLTELGVLQWLAVFGCSLAIVPIGEVYKLFSRAIRKRGAIKKRGTRNLVRESTR